MITLITIPKKHPVKHLNANVNVLITFHHMEPTTLNVYANILSNNTIASQENVPEKNVSSAVALEVPGLVHVA